MISLSFLTSELPGVACLSPHLQRPPEAFPLCHPWAVASCATYPLPLGMCLPGTAFISVVTPSFYIHTSIFVACGGVHGCRAPWENDIDGNELQR